MTTACVVLLLRLRVPPDSVAVAVDLAGVWAFLAVGRSHIVDGAYRCAFGLVGWTLFFVALFMFSAHPAWTSKGPQYVLNK